MKVYALLGLACILAGGGWWLISTVQENERLRQNNATLELSNESYKEEAAALQADLELKESLAIERQEKIAELNERVLKAQREIRVITKTVVTEKERECLNSDIPVAVLGFMFDHQASGGETGSSEGLPAEGADD